MILSRIFPLKCLWAFTLKTKYLVKIKVPGSTMVMFFVCLFVLACTRVLGIIWNSHIFMRICRGSTYLLSNTKQANVYTSKRFLNVGLLYYLHFYLTPLLLWQSTCSCRLKRAQTFSTCHCWLGVWECHPPLRRALNDQLGDPILFTLIAWFVVVFSGRKRNSVSWVAKGEMKISLRPWPDT